MDNDPTQLKTSEGPVTSGSSGALADRERIELFGLKFMVAPNEEVVAGELLEWKPEGNRPPLLVTPNSDIVIRLHEPEMSWLASEFTDAEFVLPDGWPIHQFSKIARQPLPARIAGSTVFAHWWPKLARTGRSVVVLASSASIAAGLQAEHPSASVMVAPIISADRESARELAVELVDRALESRADYVVVGLGFPKDGLIASEFQALWPQHNPGPMVLCLGASAELYLGLRKRAPEWMQKYGLEWFHRFSQEPKRMFHRYFVRSPKFIPLAMQELKRRPS